MQTAGRNMPEFRTRVVSARQLTGLPGSLNEIALAAVKAGLRVTLIEGRDSPALEIDAKGKEPEIDDLWGSMRGTVEIVEGTDLTAGTGEAWKADA